MRVIGIDIGTSMGWSVVEMEGVVESGQFDLSRDAWEGFGMRVVRAGLAMSNLLSRHPGVVVAIEKVRRHAGTQAAQVYGALLAAVTSACEANQVPYTFVSVQEVKIAATDSGAAEKAGMVAAAKAAFGVDAGEDEADAIWIAAAALLREGDPTRPPEESSVARAKRKAKDRRAAAKAVA